MSAGLINLNKYSDRFLTAKYYPLFQILMYSYIRFVFFFVFKLN